MIRKPKLEDFSVSTSATNTPPVISALAAVAAPAASTPVAAPHSSLLVERFPDAPADFKTPKGFQIDEKGGVQKFMPAQKPGMPDEIAQVTTNLCWVEAGSRDFQGNSNGLMICWIHDGEKRSSIIPKREFKKRDNAWSQMLVDQGLDIWPGQEGKLLDYFYKFEVKKSCRVINEVGFIKDDLFALPDGTAIGSESSDYEVFPSDNSEGKHGVCQKGTTEEWRKNVANPCVGNSRLLFAVSFAFAPPLAEIFEIEGGGFNYRGGSSLGKTTCAMVAASVFGGPKYMRSMRATANAFEGAAALHNNLPFIADEINQADPKQVGEIVYMLANGVGKGRADRNGSARKVMNWRLLFFMTGELSIAQYLKLANQKPMAGQEVRCIDFPVDTGIHGAFEELHGSSGGDKFSTAIKSGCSESYGIAGIEFIKYLVNCDRAELKKRFDTFQREFISKNVDPAANGQVKRVAERIALIAFAGELATEQKITGWTKDLALEASVTMLKAWISSRGGQGSYERIELLSQVQLFFEKNGSGRFEQWKHTANYIVPNRAGFRDDDTFYVYPGVYRDELIKGHDKDWATQTLIEEKLLVDGGEKNKSKKCRPFADRHQQDLFQFSNPLASKGLITNESKQGTD